MEKYKQMNLDLITYWERREFRDTLGILEKIGSGILYTFERQTKVLDDKIAEYKKKEFELGISFAADIEQIEKEKKKVKQAFEAANVINLQVQASLGLSDFNLDEFNKAKLRSSLLPSDEEIKKNKAKIQEVTDFALKSIEEELESSEISYSRRKELEKEKLQVTLDSLLKQRAAYKLVMNAETFSMDEEIKKVQEQLKSFGEDDDLPFQNASEMFDFFLNEAFGGKNAKKIAKFLKGAQMAFNEFNKMFEEAQRMQIDAIDEQLDKLGEKRQDLEKELEYEMGLRAEGLANNVGDKQKEVDAILAEEKRLADQKQAILEQQQRKQFALDTANQAQSMITSAIQIYEGFSQIPFGLGVPLAIATIASMFAFFAKTKVDAYKASKLYTGADRISDHFGYGDRYGATDLEGRGKGYRLVNEATGTPTNVIVSGREMIVPERFSLEHELFFQKMKIGAYNGLDLNSAVGFYMNYKDKANGGSVVNVNHNKVVMNQKPNRQWIPFVTKDGKSGAVLRTISSKENDGSIVYFDM